MENYEEQNVEVVENPVVPTYNYVEDEDDFEEEKSDHKFGKGMATGGILGALGTIGGIALLSTLKKRKSLKEEKIRLEKELAELKEKNNLEKEDK
mgnify:CR=1 FL=1